MAFLIIYEDKQLRWKIATASSNLLLPKVTAKRAITKEATILFQKFNHQDVFFYLAHYLIREPFRAKLRTKHPVIVLQFGIKGAFTIYHQSEDIIEEGSCQLVYYPKDHELPFELNEELHLMVLECRLETVERLSKIEPELKKYIQAARKESKEMICSPAYPINSTIRRFLLNFLDMKADNPLEMDFAIDEFFSGLLKQLTIALVNFNRARKPKDEMEQEFFKIRDYIKANLHKKLSIDYLCEKFHISRKTLERRFQDYKNISPGEFILQEKINQAKHLLIETTMSIQEIGFKLGFEESSSFTRAFKKATSYSPSEFRKKKAK